ncbi:MAG: glycosyltransferase family 39 protein, partial [Anaerolineae bacterium]|nr:glycosyltransferase family 39 protein [Anaerolineae bacterium]
NLALSGVYADSSSEGLRYYGPTVGIGPTIMLPVAAALKLGGVGLFQARMVIVLYLLAAALCFYVLAQRLGGSWFALAASALLLTSRGTGMLEYGRQVLGEVPGLFYLLAGLLAWYAAWEKPEWKRLSLAGLLLGLSLVTKNQFLIVLVPALGAAWLANLIYYKAAPQRLFIVPGAVMLACYVAWQAVLVFFLGPSTPAENFALIRAGTAEAALVFSSDLMKRALGELLSLKVYLGLLVPGLVYGLILSLQRGKDGLRWGILLALVGSNLAWYVLASVSWIRYAFPGLALSALFIARFFWDLSQGFNLNLPEWLRSLRAGRGVPVDQALRGVMLVWLGLAVLLPLAQTGLDILRPPFNAPRVMAEYMQANVPAAAEVETWEPEMGFLTDHRYHYPPQSLLYQAVSYIWRDGTAPADSYRYVQDNRPAYVLVGAFSAWVQLYPQDFLEANYTLETEIGGYRLYRSMP